MRRGGGGLDDAGAEPAALGVEARRHHLAGVEDGAAPRLDAVAAVVPRHGLVQATQVLVLGNRVDVGRIQLSS